VEDVDDEATEPIFFVGPQQRWNAEVDRLFAAVIPTHSSLNERIVF
jgi:hypothetical protein